MQRVFRTNPAIVWKLVHDEAVTEEPEGSGSLGEVLGIMGREVSYAPGLPLKGAGFENHFYYKD